MCGRFSEIESGDIIKKRFHVELKGLAWHPRYNIAPSDKVLAILNSEPKYASYIRWGMTPAWLKDGPRKELINARVEGLTTKPTFKSAFEHRRCMIIADGFYEWKLEGNHKVPYRITLKNGGLFAFAGLWSIQKNANQVEEPAGVIITVEPNELMSDIHSRMPAILRPEHERLWLNAKATSNDLLAMLAPYPASRMRAYAVSTLVNAPRNDVPGVIKPIGAPAARSRN